MRNQTSGGSSVRLLRGRRDHGLILARMTTGNLLGPNQFPARADDLASCGNNDPERDAQRHR